MARIIRATSADPSQYRGLEWIFEYTNQDGALSKWNCGQAAAATFLTHHGAMDPLRAADNVVWLEQHHPPDQLAGWFGTGRRRVERMLRAFDVPVADVFGIDRLRRELERANPVILMLGMSQGNWLGFDLPGGHWMVAFGCDAQHVYLTNGRPMRWDEIEASWQCVAARWIRMNGRGLARRL
jgi:hypothetical protein